MVQGSRISASVYLYVCIFVCVCNAQECKKYLIQCAGIRTHEANVISKRLVVRIPGSGIQPGSDTGDTTVLTISGHERLFISLDFIVQNDYGFQGCMMNIPTRL